jgi:hypothetical protein
MKVSPLLSIYPRPLTEFAVIGRKRDWLATKRNFRPLHSSSGRTVNNSLAYPADIFTLTVNVSDDLKKEGRFWKSSLFDDNWGSNDEIGSVYTRGLQRDVVYLGWPLAPSYMSPNAGEGLGGVAGVSANEYSCTHRSPKKLWRSNSVFKLWSTHLLFTSTVYGSLLYTIGFKSRPGTQKGSGPWWAIRNGDNGGHMIPHPNNTYKITKKCM